MFFVLWVFTTNERRTNCALVEKLIKNFFYWPNEEMVNWEQRAIQMGNWRETERKKEKKKNKNAPQDILLTWIDNRLIGNNDKYNSVSCNFQIEWCRCRCCDTHGRWTMTIGTSIVWLFILHYSNGIFALCHFRVEESRVKQQKKRGKLFLFCIDK